MAQFFFRRLLGVALSLLVAVTLVFFALHLTPGDPAEAALSQSAVTQDVLDRRREALGLDRPLPEQYIRFLTKLTRGDLGLSWSAGQPVSLLIGQQIGATFSLALSGMIAAVILGVGMGVAAAVGQGGWVTRVSRALTGFLLSIPMMFSATALIWVFAVSLQILPATGQGRVGQLILPTVVLGFSAAGSIARVVDSGMVDAMAQPFMQTALAKGRSWRGAITHHALWVGLLPALDVIALQFGYLLGGAVVVESVFARQGLGRLLLTAVLDKDLPVIQGVVILAALVYSLLNLLTDLVHAWLDPRIRLAA